MHKNRKNLPICSGGLRTFEIDANIVALPSCPRQSSSTHFWKAIKHIFSGEQNFIPPPNRRYITNIYMYILNSIPLHCIFQCREQKNAGHPILKWQNPHPAEKILARKIYPLVFCLILRAFVKFIYWNAEKKLATCT